MSDFKREEVLEKQVKKRYNRNVQVFRKIERDGRLVIATIKMISPKGTEYILVDYMEDGLTKYAEANGHRFRTYIEAELYVMDLIGEEEDGNN